MARLFSSGSSEYLEINSAPITAVPFTMACWFKTTDVTNFKYMMYVADKDVGDQAFALGINSDPPGLSLTANHIVGWSRSDNTSVGSVETSAAFTSGLWQHAAFVSSAVDDRAVYLNGGNKGTNSESRTPAGLDRISIARAGDSTPGYYHDGSIAEAAVWNVALTDDEAAMLGKGYSPLMIRPQSLVFYTPLIRDNDNDLVGGLSLTAYNTPTIDTHPPVQYPAPPIFYSVAGVSGGGESPWYSYANQ